MLASVDQTLVIQTEHLREEVAVGLAKPGRQRAVRQRIAGGCPQRVALRLDPNEVEAFAAPLYAGAQPHVRVGVQKVVTGAGFDAEQQIKDRVPQGGFAGLVGADDQMQVLPGRRQVDGPVGELAVAEQIKAINAHACLRVQPASAR